MTEPYVAEFCQPRTALKIPQPPPPLSSGLPNYMMLMVEIKGRREGERQRGGVTNIDVPHALGDIV
jgi:hypothetical protein